MLATVLLLACCTVDTTRRDVATVPDTLAATVSIDWMGVSPPPPDPAPRLPSTVRGVWTASAATVDTLVKKRSRLVSYSEWYGRRVTIHKAASWAMLPLFAASYYSGNRLARDGRAASPQFVRRLHPYAAGGSAAVFGVNTVTGLWNLWDARRDPEGRTRRIVHASLFLLADAGFVYAGSIGRDGRENGAIRSRHRAIALSSMGVSTAGWLIMLLGQ